MTVSKNHQTYCETRNTVIELYWNKRALHGYVCSEKVSIINTSKKQNPCIIIEQGFCEVN